ncbi:Alpha/Beta hydrolase protein [Mycena maculata]|uniref:Protein phosphatase methylesterase 1 n=1 Tax=Mycena maculata TaxID=230809 RepID=A0AAD7HFW8_9AGAR|nr:Alpha/Beta hydrolase protein [Mycena maculata]
MSNLYRSAISARLAKLPDLPPLEDEESDTLRELPTGLGPPAVPRRTPRPKAARPPNPDFAPISAEGFFADALQVDVPERGLDVRVYYTPPGNGTVLVCTHGAGYSGLSFACLAREVREVGRGEVGVLAVDSRGHGKTRTTENNEGQNADMDLSITTLAADLLATLLAVFPDPATAPTLLLVGHSMGGAVAVRACPLVQDAGYRVTGVAVIDVVEGTALAALPHMHALLNARPDGFASVEEAVEWTVKTKAIRNPHSARVSVPCTLVRPPGEGEKEGSGEKEKPVEWVWRTPLRGTAPFWEGWYTALSTDFLALRTARLLVLAGTTGLGEDRLDRPLTIAQMQGKFRMEVVQGVGHVVHEDDPTRTADVLLDFWRRNDRLRSGLPPKVRGVGEA